MMYFDVKIIINRLNHTDQLYDLKQSVANILLGNVFVPQIVESFWKGGLFNQWEEATSGVTMQHIVNRPSLPWPRCTDIYTLGKKWGMVNNVNNNPHSSTKVLDKVKHQDECEC